jgi:uncharacterized protein (TIGR02597 family)
MKFSLPCIRPLAVAICALAVPFGAAVQAQTTTATTDPVGFITLDVPGTSGNGASALSFKGLGLTRPVEYQGSAETVGAKTLVDNEATWSDNQFNGANGAYYLEVIDNPSVAGVSPGAGTTYDIVATNAASKTITLSQNLASGVASGAMFKIRKHWTLATVFGPNSGTNNQVLLAGGDATTADQVLIYNGTGYNTYYFYDDGEDRMWLSGQGADATNQIIYPEDGIIVKRRQASGASVVLMGAVKTGQSSIPVLPGLNILGNIYAAGMTLASSGLHTGNATTGVQGGDATSADQVLIYNGSGYNTYYFYDDGEDALWIDGQGNPASNVPIPVGSAVVVKRRGATGFDWVVPQHPSTL